MDNHSQGLHCSVTTPDKGRNQWLPAGPAAASLKRLGLDAGLYEPLPTTITLSSPELGGKNKQAKATPKKTNPQKAKPNIFPDPAASWQPRLSFLFLSFLLTLLYFTLSELGFYCIHPLKQIWNQEALSTKTKTKNTTKSCFQRSALMLPPHLCHSVPCVSCISCTLCQLSFFCQ